MATEENQASHGSGDGTHNHAGGHRFDAERRHLLKDEDRLRWLPPEPILHTVGIAPGAVAVDIGAGTGFWTLPLSQLVGPAGMVYAVDVEPIMHEELGTLVREKQLPNVQIVSSTEQEIPLPNAVADVGIAGFVLHEPADHAAFVREIVRLLRPGGRLLVVDWHKKPTEKGPPLEHRLAQREVETMLSDAGLTVERLDAPNAEVYVLLGRLVVDGA